MKINNKRLKLLNDTKDKKILEKEDFEQIDFINLHAHSTYSLQDAVGQVEDHFVKTIDAGHCGCCITDHGSYASFIDLHNLTKNKIGSNKVTEKFKKHEIQEHPVVMGAELYIIDDRHIQPLIDLSDRDDRPGITEILTKMSKNPQWKDIYFEKKSIEDIEVQLEKSKKIGSLLLRKINSLSNTELKLKIEEFNKASTKCTSYKYNHITLMAKNSVGHSNICHLTSIGSLPENFYVRPRIRFTDLIENKEGIIVTSGCFVGMIPQAIHKNTGLEEEYFELFSKEFGDDFYIEIHLTDVSYNWDKNLQQHVKTIAVNPMIKVNDRLVELASKYGLEKNVYITQDSHMPNKEDKAIQDIIIMNDPGNKSNWHFKNVYYIQEIEEMYEAMRDGFPHYTNEQFINWCFNTMTVLNKSRDLDIDMSLSFVKPDYDNHPVNNPIILKEVESEGNFVELYIENSKTRKEALRLLKENALDKMPNNVDMEATKNKQEEFSKTETRIEEIFQYTDYYTQKTKYFYDKEQDLQTLIRVAVELGKIDFDNEEYRRRFFFDLDTVQFNGIIALSDYFMVFEDISRLAVFLQEFKGPGRGSAAGCMVSYAIDITDVDPITYDLLMERFLQPERVGVMDFSIEGHEVVKKDEKDENFKPQIEKLEFIKKSLLDKEIDSDEMFYLERNLYVVDYIYDLKFTKKLSELPNTNNSSILFELGLCVEPIGKIKKSEPSMPDIDYDSSCRDLICEYLLKKHGTDNACYIGTYGSLKVRSAIKEVLRVRRINGRLMEASEVNKLTKEIDKVKPSEEDMSKGELFIFNLIIENSQKFHDFFTEHEDVKNDVTNILGTYKNMGIHAAGMVLSSTPITRKVPCTWDKAKGAYKTQLAKEEVEQIGLIKLDLLGISTGEDIRDCARLILKNKGINYFSKWETILNNLPKEVGQSYVKVDTTSIFQMNTPVSMDLLKSVTIMNDPVRDNAAYTSALRPGPMSAGVHKDLVDTINKIKPETYLHPSLEIYLKDTYGFLIYQEQVMQICIDLGGFTKFEADKVRKAMGKKKFKIINMFEKQFVEYAHNTKSIDKNVAREIWQNMAAFAEYGFNKSHAICYAAVSCICMYFKTQYPLEWKAACLGRVSRNDSEADKKNYKRYYREWKSDLRSPSINKSGDSYQIINRAIYMPIYAAKAIKKDTALKISSLAPFKDFDDCVLKLKANDLGRKDLVEALVYSGACDELFPKITKDNLNKENIDQIRFFVDAINFIHAKDLKLDSSEEGDTLDLLGITNAQGSFDINKQIQDLDLISYSLTNFEKRKYLIQRYYNDLKVISIKKGLMDKMKELEEYSFENRYLLTTTKDLNSIKCKDIEIYSKWSGLDKNGEPKSLKIKLGKKDLEDAQKIEEVLRVSHDKSILAKELDYLNFTSYNFSKMFKEEIDQISLGQNKQILKLEDMVKEANKINSKVDKIRHFINNKLRITKDTPILQIRKNAVTILVALAHIQKVFGKWQLSCFISQIEENLEQLGSTQKSLMTWALELELQNYSVQLKLDRRAFNEMVIIRKSKVILDKQHTYILKNVIGSKADINQANMLRSINYSLSHYADLLKLAYLVSSDSQKSKEMRLSGGKSQKDIRGLLRLQKKENREIVLVRLEELGVSNKMLEDLIDTDIPRSEIINEINQLKIYYLNDYQINIVTKPSNVFGSIFIPEKKMYKKEYTNYKGVSRVMNIHLTDGNESVMVNIKEYDKIEIFRKSQNVSFESIVKDFSPLILPVKLNFNLSRAGTFNLRFENQAKGSIVFVEDYL